MKMTFNASPLFLVISFAVLSACAGSKAQAPGAAGQTSARATNDSDEEVCEIERPTGSHFPARVCRTRQRIQNDTNQAQDIMSRSGSAQPQTSNPR